MYQVVPNSHSWNNLEMIILNIDHDIQWRNSKSEREKRIKNADHMIVDMHEPLTIDYLLIGLSNTMCDETELVFNGNFEKLRMNTDPHFTCINDMVDFLKAYREDKVVLESWSLDRFKTILENTLKCGFDLKRKFVMERKEIYNRIDGERNYQDKTWVERRTLDGTPDEEKPVAEWVNYIEFHISKAKDKIYNLDTLGATDELRKVAALAVRAMEIHGCPMRDVIAEDGEKD